MSPVLLKYSHVLSKLQAPLYIRLPDSSLLLSPIYVIAKGQYKSVTLTLLETPRFLNNIVFPEISYPSEYDYCRQYNLFSLGSLYLKTWKEHEFLLLLYPLNSIIHTVLISMINFTNIHNSFAI